MTGGSFGKILYLTPRWLGVIAAGFLGLFALDIFDLNLGFWGTVVGLGIHLIPSLLILLLTVLAWRNSRWGSVLFVLISLVLFLFTGGYRDLESLVSGLVLFGPLLLIAGLYYWDFRLNH